jgi:hypothetical protein
MFVRFKRKVTHAGEVFNVSLEQRYRDPARLGQVQSETICGLGSVPVTPHPTEASLYWIKLDAKLEDLSLSADDEEKVRASIESRIPRPTLPLPQLVRMRQSTTDDPALADSLAHPKTRL